MSLKAFVSVFIAYLALAALVHGNKATESSLSNALSAIKEYSTCACKCHPANGRARFFARKDCRFSAGNCAITKCITRTGYPGWWCCSGPTPTPSPTPSMAAAPKHLCNRRVCCLNECGKCGGRGCAKRPGGSRNCCIYPIEKSKRSCEYFPPPCVLPQH